MIYDDTAFLHSLCHRAAGVAGVPYGPPGAAPWPLWLGDADEGPDPADPYAADPYTVLRAWGGSMERLNPTPTLKLQLDTRGTDVNAARRQARQLFEAFALSGQGMELRMQPVPGYAFPAAGPPAVADAPDGTAWTLVSAVALNPPGQTGREPGRGRFVFTSNFEVAFFRQQQQRPPTPTPGA